MLSCLFHKLNDLLKYDRHHHSSLLKADMESPTIIHNSNKFASGFDGTWPRYFRIIGFIYETDSVLLAGVE